MELRYSYIYLVGFVAIVVAVAFLVINFVLPKIGGTGPADEITDFVTSSLRPEYVTSFEVIAADSSTYGTGWIVNDTNFTVVLEKNADGEGVKQIKIRIRIPISLNDSNTSLVNVYLKDPGTNWECVSLTNPPDGKLCESFSENLFEKIGKSILIVTDRTTVVACKIPKGSDIYGNNTCGL